MNGFFHTLSVDGYCERLFVGRAESVHYLKSDDRTLNARRGWRAGNFAGGQVQRRPRGKIPQVGPGERLFPSIGFKGRDIGFVHLPRFQTVGRDVQGLEDLDLEFFGG